MIFTYPPVGFPHTHAPVPHWCTRNLAREPGKPRGPRLDAHLQRKHATLPGPVGASLTTTGRYPISPASSELVLNGGPGNVHCMHCLYRPRKYFKLKYVLREAETLPEKHLLRWRRTT